jgi:F0F1-type ATP synthase delta subunit
MTTDYKTLIAHLRHTGRMKLLPQVLRELRTQAAREALLAPKVEVAHEKESARALRLAGAAGIHAKHARVNHSLVKGFRARSGSTLMDQSAKRALIDIYQQITT